MPLRKIYWDSCIFIELLHGSEAAYLPAARRLLRDVKSGRLALITSAVTWAEILPTHHVQSRDALSELEQLMGSRSVIVADVTTPIAMLARDLRNQDLAGRDARSGPAQGVARLADSLHLATALHFEVDELHSSDRGLQRFAERRGVGLIVGLPRLLQLDLPL